MENRSARSLGTGPVPKARADRLLVQELMDEVVVYDLDRHRSHCLDRVAALIWRRCDGSRSVAEMARLLYQELGAPVEEEAIWLALNRLSRARLLQEKVCLPMAGDRTSRRAILRGLAAFGGAALVSSVVVPGVAAGSSVPPQCIITCCVGDCSTSCASTCASCKCCFIGATQTVQQCAANCGGQCNSLGGTCFQQFCK